MCSLADRIILFIVILGGCGEIYTKLQKNDRIKLKLYTKNNSDPYKINIENIADIPIDLASRLEILVHGWRGDSYLPWIKLMKDTLLENGSKNVLIVDWKGLANKIITKIPSPVFVNRGIRSNRECKILGDGVSDILWGLLPSIIYKRWTENIPIVGEYVGELLISLAEAKNLSMKNIQIIGFSLGAHVAGSIGKTIKTKIDKKIGRITGLDPAGPLFRNVSAEKRLDKDDAMFVDVIHTHGMMYGLYMPIGHVDFYVNGGCTQKCSKLDKFPPCSHLLACNYFIESIKSNEFISTLCDSYKNYEEGQCEHRQKVSMGCQLEKTASSGNYYLNTNIKPPYAKG
ncbi:phospholipase A1-like [Chrysoperla carnea]|uniref:phospholipase A1-like n=1 Tax=Chrysoperla carnea TaxID=189513 RepID=UPI001D085B05|nr:phospholipase A1-like [Chrysoperla carnea]